MKVDKFEMNYLYGILRSEKIPYKSKRATTIKLVDLVIHSRLTAESAERVGVSDADILSIVGSVIDLDIYVSSYDIVNFSQRSDALRCNYKLLGGILIASI